MMMTNESLVELVQCKYDVMKYLRHHLATLILIFLSLLFFGEQAEKSFPENFPPDFCVLLESF